jgi:hypothetical protein
MPALVSLQEGWRGITPNEASGQISYEWRTCDFRVFIGDLPIGTGVKVEIKHGSNVFEENCLLFGNVYPKLASMKKKAHRQDNGAILIS